MAAARPQLGYNVPDTYESLIAPRYAPVADELVRLAAPRPGDQVLELGAGTGLVTRRVAPLVAGGTVAALDKYEQMLEKAREVVTDADVRWLIGDYNEPLPFAAESFDLVLSGLTYVQDTDEPVAEVLRVLRPGGRFALSMWGPAYRELDLMNRAKERLGDPPIPSPDPHGVIARLTAAGLEDVEVHELELAPQYRSIDDYLAYRRGFGVPLGSSPDDHERYLRVLGEEASAVANADGSFTQGWRFALIRARRP